MKLGRKLATLVRSLAHRSAPQQKETNQPLSNQAPERLADERVLRPEDRREEPLEQVRVADLLQSAAHSLVTRSGNDEKENGDE